MFDNRADTFCLVTGDSDFAYLCRKLRERGATVCIVGETKTPDTLRNASDQFFEWVHPATQPEQPTAEQPATKAPIQIANRKEPPEKPPATKTELNTPHTKKRPKFLIEAVALLASDTSEGKVGLGPLGQYLKRTDPAFSPKLYGHSGLLDMVKSYDFLQTVQEVGGNWSVKIKPTKTM